MAAMPPIGGSVRGRNWSDRLEGDCPSKGKELQFEFGGAPEVVEYGSRGSDSAILVYNVGGVQPFHKGFHGALRLLVSETSGSKRHGHAFCQHCAAEF